MRYCNNQLDDNVNDMIGKDEIVAASSRLKMPRLSLSPLDTIRIYIPPLLAVVVIITIITNILFDLSHLHLSI